LELEKGTESPLEEQFVPKSLGAETKIEGAEGPRIALRELENRSRKLSFELLALLRE
jgi:hypothetical protein